MAMATRPTRTGAHLLALMSHTSRRLLATSRFAFASEEELSKLADLVNEGFAPANTARQNHSLGTINDFQQWMAIIIVTLLHAVHVYRYYVAIIIIIDFAVYILLLFYVYQLFYYNETAIQHLMTSCMPEGGKYKLYFRLYPSGRENILVIHRLVWYKSILRWDIYIYIYIYNMYYILYTYTIESRNQPAASSTIIH